MTTEGPGPTGRHSDRFGDDDDLGRAFGTDTSSVPVRTTPQRVRAWSLLLAGVVVVAAVIIVVLSMIIGSVQTGVGGIFPRPDASLQRFTEDAGALDGVISTDATKPTKTSFASYDVTATVTASTELSPDQRTALIDQLSEAVADASGNGVHVYAIADLGDVDVGISPSKARTDERLRLARAIRQVAGVQQVRCVWAAASEGRADTPAGQSVEVETAPTGVDVLAVQAQVTGAVHRVFPDAAVQVVAAKQ